jgi:hypothetical protein
MTTATVTTSCGTCWQPATVLLATVQHYPDGANFVGTPRPMCGPCALDTAASIDTATAYDYRLPYATAVQLTPLTPVRLGTGKTCPPWCRYEPGHRTPHDRIGA